MNANRTVEDVLLREKMDTWTVKKERLKVLYVVEESRVGIQRCACHGEYSQRPYSGAGGAYFGPPAMVQLAVQPNLEKMNNDTKN